MVGWRTVLVTCQEERELSTVLFIEEQRVERPKRKTSREYVLESACELQFYSHSFLRSLRSSLELRIFEYIGDVLENSLESFKKIMAIRHNFFVTFQSCDSPFP